MDSFDLATRHPVSRDGAPALTRWFTYPEGLARAGLRCRPRTQLVCRVLGVADERRGAMLVSEADTQDTDGAAHSDEVPMGAKAFHRTRSGHLFSNAAQEQLRTIAEAHRYVSTTWHVVTAGNGHRFRPNSPTHALAGPAKNFPKASAFINGDNYVTVEEEEQLSGWTGSPFSLAVSEKLHLIAAERRFASNRWIGVNEVDRGGVEVKPGEEPTAVAHTGTRLYNYDQLVDPPADALKWRCRRSPSTQVSGKTGRFFCPRTSPVLERAGKANGFASNVWITVSRAQRMSCVAKPRASPVPVSVGNTTIEYYNFDQLVDPPAAVGAGALPCAIGERSRQPVSIDRKPFVAPPIVQALSNTSFQESLWATAGQLASLSLRPRVGEVPIAVSLTSHPLGNKVLFYNVEQLENPSALRDMPPQWIDDEPIYGLDSSALRIRQPPATAGAPASARWFTYPDGLKRAGRIPLPHATLTSFVWGLGISRRGESLISEAHTEVACGRGAPPSASLEQRFAFHKTCRGILFGNAAQTQLRVIAQEQRYTSTVWHRVTSRNLRQFRPGSVQHSLSARSDSFSSASAFINGDDVVAGNVGGAPLSPC
jgi:hypothetical protein